MSLNEATNPTTVPVKLDSTETISRTSSEVELAELAEKGEIKANHVIHKRGLKPFIALAAVIAALGAYNRRRLVRTGISIRHNL